MSAATIAGLLPMATIDERVQDWFGPVADEIASVVFYSVSVGDASLPLIVVWLVIAAVFFTAWLGLPQIRGFKHAINLVRGRYSDPHDAGEVSHFQALATAVSGTVGLGNIAGVAVAISLGGPGATFWMILAGFLGMATKMAECTLGVMYRHEHEDGTVSGGPMYYLRDGVAQVTGSGPLGKFLAAFFAICCIGGAIGGGNMFQANQATAQIIDVTGGDDSVFADLKWLIGLLFAIAVGAVIIGGIKSIARVTEKVVPVHGRALPHGVPHRDPGQPRQCARRLRRHRQRCLQPGGHRGRLRRRAHRRASSGRRSPTRPASGRRRSRTPRSRPRSRPRRASWPCSSRSSTPSSSAP